MHAVDLEADVAVGHLVVYLQFRLHLVVTWIGSGGQQVLQIDPQTIPRGDSQHQGPWAFVGAQQYLARIRASAFVQRHVVVIDHIPAQREDHAVDVLRAEPVEHQGLVDRHHVGDQVARATDRRLGVLGRQQAGHQQHQQPTDTCEALAPSYFMGLRVEHCRCDLPVHLG